MTPKTQTGDVTTAASGLCFTSSTIVGVQQKNSGMEMGNWSECSVTVCRIPEAGWDEIGRGCLIGVIVVGCFCKSEEGYGGG